ncbi:MAG: hemerythrin domain-containing protein [Myxococcales bacterium]|nr:hemerythrin domain-containing protein [Myxococcales bacterium]MCB9535403.1 hemerythrin domain-containing protein [Myxococcales bacterium]
MSPTDILADVAARHPEAVPILHAHDLDFALEGHLTLEDACRTRGLVAAEVLDAVARQASPGGRDWEDQPILALVQRLAERHAGLGEQLDRACELAETALRSHGHNVHLRLPAIYSALRDLRRDLADHVERARRGLVPALVAGDVRRVDEHAEVMRVTHAGLGVALRSLRTLTHDFAPPVDDSPSLTALCALLVDVERALREAMHFEGYVLFLRALGRAAA